MLCLLGRPLHACPSAEFAAVHTLSLGNRRSSYPILRQSPRFMPYPYAIAEIWYGLTVISSDLHVTALPPCDLIVFATCPAASPHFSSKLADPVAWILTLGKYQSPR